MHNYISDVLNKQSKLVITDEFKEIFTQLEETDKNYFLTGNAGSGKSTLITHFRWNSNKNIVVLAPTGLAAINVRGQTIHSFFKFPPKIITKDTIDAMYSDSRMFMSVDTVVIDEASMIRADLFDGIDLCLRRFGRDKSLPFGGTQIILVGDLFQLPPVVTNAERGIIERFYDTPYFFSSNAYVNGRFETLKLTQIFRQEDVDFINLLNKIRIGDIKMRDMNQFNTRVRNGVCQLKKKRAVTLTTTNNVANDLNSMELSKLEEPEYTYQAEIVGIFNEKENNIPVPLELRLRNGARVMFIKNGSLWVNGSLGEVIEVTEISVKVRLDDSDIEVVVPKEKWEQVKYRYDEREHKVIEEVIWTIWQFPLRLAWAITIHKSQGMTFDRVNIDYSRSPFAHGQTYVALSRCRTLNGITLSKELYPNDVIVDDRIIKFSSNKAL